MLSYPLPPLKGTYRVALSSNQSNHTDMKSVIKRYITINTRLFSLYEKSPLGDLGVLDTIYQPHNAFINQDL